MRGDDKCGNTLAIWLSLAALLLGCSSQSDADGHRAPDSGSADAIVDVAADDGQIPDSEMPDAGNDAFANVCPTFAEPATVGDVQNLAITEASGVVGSRKIADVLWVHNDSGDQPRVFAISTTGAALGTFNFDAAGAADWEDIAIGPGPTSGESEGTSVPLSFYARK